MEEEGEPLSSKAMQIKLLTAFTAGVIIYESLTFKDESKPQITELP